MKKKIELLAPDLRILLANENQTALREFCETGHPAVVAETLSSLTGKEAWSVLKLASHDHRAEIFSHMAEDIQVEIIETLRRRDIARLLSDMPPDDRVHLYKRLPEHVRESVLPALAHAEREDIRRLATYEDGTAGAVMTSDYATLPPDMTAAQAIEHLREIAPDKETIYYAYVVDSQRKLIGFVSLRDLIVAKRGAVIGEIMHRDAVFSTTSDDQEEAARKIQKYDLLALPILNEEGALVGLLTHDDALDIITQETTEDMEKLMAISGKHEVGGYLRTSSWTHFKNRAAWIVGLAGLELFSGLIIHSYQDVMGRLLILALYMPMIADAGGNTGSQSATIMVRALALGEIKNRDIWRVLYKEMKISFMLAVILGALSWGKVMFLSHAADVPAGFSLLKVGLTIALALGVQVVSATLIGALLPLGANKMKWDPALVASPALATVVDITGLLIYFTTAKLLLNI